MNCYKKTIKGNNILLESNEIINNSQAQQNEIFMNRVLEKKQKATARRLVRFWLTLSKQQ